MKNDSGRTPRGLSRRSFIKTAPAVAATAAMAPRAALAGEAAKKTKRQPLNCYNYTSISGVQNLSIWSEWIKEDIHLFVLADTHLFETDARNLPYSEFSARMSKAYNSVPHHESHQATTPAVSLKESLEIAGEKRPDAVVHLGDLVSFPSEYSIEYAARLFRQCGLPCYYISGNHDWCYEGFEADAQKHRATFMPRLKPLYPEGVDPLQYSIVIKGLKLIFIDDSTGDVTDGQIEFFRKEVAEDIPSILMMHIGLFLPGHESFYLGFPDYIPTLGADGAVQMISAADGSHAANIERFHAEVQRANAHNKLLAVVAGHNHVVKAEEIGPLRQFVVPLNADGSYTDLHIHPATTAPRAKYGTPPKSALGWF